MSKIGDTEKLHWIQRCSKFQFPFLKIATCTLLQPFDFLWTNSVIIGGTELAKQATSGG